MRIAEKCILVSVVVLVVTGCADTGPKTLEAPMVTRFSNGDELVCGEPFRAPEAGDLTLVAEFPSSAAAADGVVTGTVEVTSKRGVAGVAGPRAQAFLVREGRVVSMPMAQDLSGVRWDLAGGAVERLPADAALVSCEPGGAPLPPGSYELWARLVVTPDDGPGVTSVAGPWPIEIT